MIVSEGRVGTGRSFLLCVHRYQTARALTPTTCRELSTSLPSSPLLARESESNATSVTRNHPNSAQGD